MMPDREKVKKGFERCLSGKMPFGCGECLYFGDEEYNDAWSCRLSLMRDAFAMLKEQEEREKTIYNEICNFIRGACSTDTDDDKDFVCYEIQRIFNR